MPLPAKFRPKPTAKPIEPERPQLVVFLRHGFGKGHKFIAELPNSQRDFLDVERYRHPNCLGIIKFAGIELEPLHIVTIDP